MSMCLQHNCPDIACRKCLDVIWADAKAAGAKAERKRLREAISDLPQYLREPLIAGGSRVWTWDVASVLALLQEEVESDANDAK